LLEDVKLLVAAETIPWFEFGCLTVITELDGLTIAAASTDIGWCTPKWVSP